MLKKVAIRNYHFTDGELIVEGNSLLTSARRDVTEFTIRNYTEINYFAPLEIEIDAFSALPTDAELKGIQMDKTEIKNADADNVKMQVRVIMNAAGSIFGEHSGKYARFGTKGMDKMSDPELLTCGRRVTRTATALLTDLASRGITAPIIATLVTTMTTFEDDINKQLDATNDRDNAVETRIDAGNAVYAKLVSLANTGKNIWVDVNESKHNDYVIYDSPTPTPPVPPVPPVV